MPDYEPITGRYFSMDVAGESLRIYLEEAGSGIPLVCLHTAGSDCRQFRHLLCDPAVTDHFRVIAFDMPWHGKSSPPVGWEREEYQLTTRRYTDMIMAFCRALTSTRPSLRSSTPAGRTRPTARIHSGPT